MLSMKKTGAAAMFAIGMLATRVMASNPTLLSFDAQTNPPPSNLPEFQFNGSFTTGAGSTGDGDGALLGLGTDPGLTINTPLTIAPGTLGEQNNLDGSTTFYDVTLQLTGLSASGGAGSGPLLNQLLTSGTFLFSSSNSGGGPGTPLLGGTFTSAHIVGASNSSSGDELSGTITYNSGLIYSRLVAQGGGITGGNTVALNSISPVLGTTSGTLNNFSADGNGTFNVTLLPEPSAISLLLVGGAALFRRRRA